MDSVPNWSGHVPMYWPNHWHYYITPVSSHHPILTNLKLPKSYRCTNNLKNVLWTITTPLVFWIVSVNFFEKLVHKQLLNSVCKHYLLYQYQFGFRKSHSNTLPLFEIIDGIKYHIDKGEAVIGTYLDLKKASDTVNHGILCANLEHYGIIGMSLNFFQSYLGNRKQFVSCNNTSSYTTTNKVSHKGLFWALSYFWFMLMILWTPWMDLKSYYLQTTRHYMSMERYW